MIGLHVISQIGSLNDYLSVKSNTKILFLVNHFLFILKCANLCVYSLTFLSIFHVSIY
nr:MAG TPA: hypothetical protein [Caudoviricetes sp.]